MATVREGNRGALLVVDVRAGVSTQHVPVIWVQHSDDELATLSATHVAVAGAATNWCIRATAYAALERGYDLTLVQDAHTTGTMELEKGKRIEAAPVVDELNIAMTWVSYPGRSNGTATAEEIDFATPGGAR